MNAIRGLLAVCGPTASGKTALALSLAEALDTEVVSFDARQLYRELRIGVARPPEDVLKRVHHHFIASHSIHQPLTAARYAQEAAVVVEKLMHYKKVVVLVGGSGFYLNALLWPLDDIPEVRPEARSQARTMPLSGLQELVQKYDPDYFAQADRCNKARLARAAEVILSTGRPYSSFLKDRKTRKARYPLLAVQPAVDDQSLRRFIHERTRTMWQEGLAEECRTLLPFRELQPLRSVGYAETFDYLEGLRSEEETLQRIEKNTQQYARRQKTWFRHQLPQEPLSLTQDAALRFAEKLKTGALAFC